MHDLQDDHKRALVPPSWPVYLPRRRTRARCNEHTRSCSRSARLRKPIVVVCGADFRHVLVHFDGPHPFLEDDHPGAGSIVARHRHLTSLLSAASCSSSSSSRSPPLHPGNRHILLQAAWARPSHGLLTKMRFGGTVSFILARDGRGGLAVEGRARVDPPDAKSNAEAYSVGATDAAACCCWTSSSSSSNALPLHTDAASSWVVARGSQD
ncbi:hypothetical protein V8E36_004452 [Tilletia maclaganii]